MCVAHTCMDRPHSVRSERLGTGQKDLLATRFQIVQWNAICQWSSDSTHWPEPRAGSFIIIEFSLVKIKKKSFHWLFIIDFVTSTTTTNRRANAGSLAGSITGNRQPVTHKNWTKKRKAGYQKLTPIGWCNTFHNE